MIEEGQPPGRDKDALLYDYAKHLLSLALLGVGGVASITQSPLGRDIQGGQVAIVLGAFALAGLCALSCSATILRAYQRDTPVPRSAWWYHQGAMLWLGAGVGGFLLTWIDALV